MSDRVVDHPSSLISDPSSLISHPSSSKNNSLEQLLQFAREIEVAIVGLAARLRNHLNHHGDRSEEATAQVIAERIHGLSVEFLAPFADGSAFTEPEATARVHPSSLNPDPSSLPLVSIGQGTSRRDYYESDFSRVGGSAEGGFTHGSDSRKVGGSAVGGFTHGSDTTIPQAGPKASKNHKHFLSSAGMA